MKLFLLWQSDVWLTYACQRLMLVADSLGKCADALKDDLEEKEIECLKQQRQFVDTRKDVGYRIEEVALNTQL